MELNRKPFQGVLNIIRFNWHFYLISGLVITTAFVFLYKLPQNIHLFAFWLLVLATLTILISVLISFYIFDISKLYQLSWIPNLNNKKALNINAGFDETSEIIRRKYSNIELVISDFYDPNKHTEVSIKRARKAYPPLDKTIKVLTSSLPFQDNLFDCSLAIFSAHEIRNQNERINFFKELNRITNTKGQIIVTEHLRDYTNFLAYTVGFFHFYSKSNWLHTFKQANLVVEKEIKTTPFITTYILKKNGDTL